MTIGKFLGLGVFALFLLSACSGASVTPEPTGVSVPVPVTVMPTEIVLPTASPMPTAFINVATALAGTRPPHTPVTPTRTRTATATRPPGAPPVVGQGGKPEPTVLQNAKRIPETHAGRTQCLTCHEFGNVGPPMPQFHTDDQYNDNSICKRCHLGP